MTHLGLNRCHILLLLLATLALRVMIPVGYMPAVIGSGLLFELCPEGMPATVMQALGGHHHHHEPNSDGDQASFDTEQCPVGHLLSSSMAVEFGQDLELDVFVPLRGEVRIESLSVVFRAEYRSRAPPPVKLS